MLSRLQRGEGPYLCTPSPHRDAAWCHLRDLLRQPGFGGSGETLYRGLQSAFKGSVLLCVYFFFSPIIWTFCNTVSEFWYVVSAFPRFLCSLPHRSPSPGLRAEAPGPVWARCADGEWPESDTAGSFRPSFRQQTGNSPSFSLAAGTRTPAYPVLGLAVFSRFISQHPVG